MADSRQSGRPQGPPPQDELVAAASARMAALLPEAQARHLSACAWALASLRGPAPIGGVLLGLSQGAGLEGNPNPSGRHHFPSPLPR